MDQTPTQVIAANVRAEVSRAGFNRREFGREMGWKPTSSWRRLEGEQPMSLDLLIEVAAKLNVPLATLLNGVGDHAVSA